ncbi:MAG: penicillin-binding protein activator [Pseudomonadota bacterium]
MFAQFARLRKVAIWLLMLPFFTVLAACMGGTLTGNTGPSINTRAPVPVALLVPIGSADTNEQKLAQDLENAARLASTDLSGVQIDLRVYPTAGNPSKAQESTQQAINDGAKIIIGPLRAESATAAAQTASGRGVNVLAFSNNAAIAGGNLFVLGQTFDSTATRLVDYAVSQGRDRILTVFANNDTGRVGKVAIDRAIATNGAVSAGNVSYEFSQEAVINAVPDIRSSAEANEANAIFFTANTAGALPLFTQMLPESGLDTETTQYIGLSRWDTPPQTLELPGVQGGWFALPDPQRNSQFRARYEAAYGNPPHALAGLAYDGIAAVGALASSGKSDALTRSSLIQPAGFQGVNGVFRFMPDGTNQRALAVATVENKEVVVISPAPTSFGSAGF